MSPDQFQDIDYQKDSDGVHHPNAQHTEEKKML